MCYVHPWTYIKIWLFRLQDFLRRARAEETRAEQRFKSTQRMDELERDLEQRLGSATWAPPDLHHRNNQ